VITQASTQVTGVHPSKMLLKFATNENHQAALRGRKGLARTKLGLDKYLTLVQQARKLELWPFFKKAKVAGKCAF
jgi:hypothetical protein